MTTLFSDESRYGLFSDSHRIKIWTPRETPLLNRYIQETAPFRGGTLMVWGGICYNGRTELHVCNGTMTGQMYRDTIINNIVEPFHGAIGDNFRFLDDNARAHRANIVLQRLDQHGIQVLPLPPRSPDLNPVEHAWDMLQRVLEQQSPAPNMLHDLGRLLPELWQMLPVENLNNLVQSMPRRVEAVIQARGGHTLY